MYDTEGMQIHLVRGLLERCDESSQFANLFLNQ